MVKCKTADDGGFCYIISDDDGRAIEVFLYGAARDPLRSVANCLLKIVDEDGKKLVKGIMVDDDWVEMK